MSVALSAAPERKLAALVDFHKTVFKIERVKLANHLEGLVVADDFHIREPSGELLKIGAVVGLHMVDYGIIERAAFERGVNVFKKLAGNG